jgi:hypothetical protein
MPQSHAHLPLAARMFRYRVVVLLALALGMAIALALVSMPPTLARGADERSGWPMIGHDVSNTRSQPRSRE